MRGIRVLVRSLLVPAALVAAAPDATGGEVVWRAASPGGALVVEGAPGGRTARVATIEKPGVATASWAVRGEVATRDVEGSGYLEMWSVFPDGARYFSRTLGDEGPMARLSGTAPRRPFVLPFFSKPGMVPERLEVNVVLPGTGRVELSGVVLLQLAPGEDPMAPEGAWLSAPAIGVAGGILGALLGCAGALAGLLASRGKARAAVLGLFAVLIGVGVLLVAVGAAALAAGQPGWLSGACLFAGLLSAVIPLATLPAVRRRFEEAELRRMRSLDPI